MAEKSKEIRIKELFELYKDGAITIDEYESLKANILNEPNEIKKTSITNNLSDGIEKSLKGDFKGAIFILKPILSNIIDDLSSSRALLYYTYCLSQNGSTLDEVKLYFKKIKFSILKENYYEYDELVLLKIGCYIVDKEYDYKFLNENFILNDFFTEKSKSELLDLIEKIIIKQIKVKEFKNSIHTIERAKALFPTEEKFMLYEDEVKKLIERRKRNIKKLKKIISLVFVILIITTSIISVWKNYVTPYFDELTYYENAKSKMLPWCDYKCYLNKYPNGRYVEEVEQLYWKEISTSDDELIFKDFILKRPNSKFINEAYQKIKLIREKEQEKWLSMIFVQGGTFTMGSNYDNAKPAHQVTLSDFYIGKYEVTQVLWNTVMNKFPAKYNGYDNPVTEVSWDDVQEFIKKLNAMTGLTYRLPTEAEWEYAAKGGNKSKGYEYSGSNFIEKVALYDNGNSKSGFIFDPFETYSVEYGLPNELGIHGMSGNVWEWCQDSYRGYTSSSKTNPLFTSNGADYVIIRGGSWESKAYECLVTHRGMRYPDYSDNTIGFRLVLVK